MILEVKFKGKLHTEAVSFVLLKQISTITTVSPESLQFDVTTTGLN